MDTRKGIRLLITAVAAGITVKLAMLTAEGLLQAMQGIEEATVAQGKESDFLDLCDDIQIVLPCAGDPVLN